MVYQLPRLRHDPVEVPAARVRAVVADPDPDAGDPIRAPRAVVAEAAAGASIRRIRTGLQVEGSPAAVVAAGDQLRATLAVISGYSQSLLHLDLDDDRRRSYLTGIVQAVGTLSEQTEEIIAIVADDGRPSHPVPDLATVFDGARHVEGSDDPADRRPAGPAGVRVRTSLGALAATLVFGGVLTVGTMSSGSLPYLLVGLVIVVAGIGAGRRHPVRLRALVGR